MRMLWALLVCGPLTAATPCEDLARLALRNVTVDAARPLDTGACQVAATIRPTADSEIRIELWLPANWNSKLLAHGNGGWSGSINAATLKAVAERGYAA